MQGLLSLLRWRWTPFFALVFGSFLFVLVISLLIPAVLPDIDLKSRGATVTEPDLDSLTGRRTTGALTGARSLRPSSLTKTAPYRKSRTPFNAARKSGASIRPTLPRAKSPAPAMLNRPVRRPPTPVVTARPEATAEPAKPEPKTGPGYDEPVIDDDPPPGEEAPEEEEEEADEEEETDEEDPPPADGTNGVATKPKLRFNALPFQPKKR